ncbi:MAG: ABC transporter substrate-binding protein, partial [Sulfurifustis sp.]
MNARRRFLRSVAALAVATAFAPPAMAEDTITLGELNSYKTFPGFLEPYRKGWQLALEEVNASGGVLGRKLEIVSRDDNGNPGDAVRVAEELLTREKVQFIMGTFPSNIGLAVADFAKQKKVFFLAAEPLTDKIVWDNGNRYTFRLQCSTYMQTAMLVPEAAKLKKKRWAIVYPNYEYGQSATRVFKELLKKAQPDVEFVVEQATPLGKIDAGAVVQALADAKPDAIFSSLFAGDLARFVREGNTRGLFKGREVFNLLGGWPEYLDLLKDETPEGWYVTGYPWYGIDAPAHKKFLDAYQRRWNDYPRAGSVVGYA